MAAGCKSFVRPWKRANPIGRRPGRDDCCAVTAISKNLINSRKKDRDRKCERQPEVDRFETWRKDEDEDSGWRRGDEEEEGEAGWKRGKKSWERKRNAARQEGKIP